MKIINSLSRILNIAASGVLAAMMFLTVSDVLLRYFLRRPILGATELTENMMVCLAFLGLAWCAVQEGHLKVDLVMTHFSPRVQAIVDSITSCAGLILVALIAWRGFLRRPRVPGPEVRLRSARAAFGEFLVRCRRAHRVCSVQQA